MTVLLSNFTFDDDPNEVDAFDAALTPVAPGSTNVVLLADGGDTLDGSDSIVAFGNYIIEEPIVLDSPIDLEPELSTKAFGIFVALEPPKTELPDVDTDVFTRGGNDVVIGAVQLINPNNYSEVVAFGYVANFNVGDLFTGTGDDIVAGLASGLNATTVGIGTADISVEEDNDIVVGAASTTDQFALVEDLTTVGITLSTINGGTGADIVAGAAVMIGETGGSFSASGVVSSDIVFENDALGDIAIGIGLGVGDSEKPPLGTSDMIEQFGLAGGVLTFGDGDDTAVGAIALSETNGAFFEGNTGVVFGHQVTLGEGNNTLLGLAAASIGGDGTITFNAGISGLVIAGDGNDLIIGATLSQTGQNVDALNNTGIGGPNDIGSEIYTAGGADTVIGIFDASAGGNDSEIGFNYGIAAGTIETGAQDDIVIGLSMPLSGGALGGGEYFSNYGIAGTASFGFVGSINQEIINETTSDIRLGDGDDFIFARGLTGGILNVNIEGGIGNDVFDIQSGFGRIDGGDDIDTLILQGGGYIVSGVGHDTEDPLEEIVPSVYITRADDTNLLVENVEFVVIDGVTSAIGDLLI